MRQIWQQMVGSVILIITLSNGSLAQSCCSGGVPLSTSIGLPRAAVGTWQFSLNYDLNVLNTLKDATTTLDDDSRRRITHSILAQAGYTFTQRFSADLFISYVRQERRIMQFGNINNTATNGIGDAVVLLKYSVLPFLQLGLGVKAPTGATDKTRDDGIALNADLQPGSGSWDGILWGSFNTQLKSRPSFTLFNTTTFRLTGANGDYLGSEVYEFGNEFQTIVGASDRLVIGKIMLDPSLAFRFRKVAADKNDNQEVGSTGGQWIFINPGVSYNITPSLSWQVNGEIPLYSKLVGTQLTPTFRINTGLFFTLGGRRNNIEFKPDI